MNPVRSLLAVLGGMGVVSILVEVLEFALISAVAGGTVTDMPGYFAVRNRPAMMGAQVVYNFVAAVLGGYVAARVAGTREMLHGGMAAFGKTMALGWGFTAGEFAGFTPVWLRVVLVVATGPGMLLGAWVRARAARSDT